MRKRYRATLQALNDDCIGRKAHGFANLEVTDDDALQIRIEMFNTPADMTHMAGRFGRFRYESASRGCDSRARRES